MTTRVLLVKMQFKNHQNQPKNASCVYWIHLPEHTDMFKDGYIGITKNKAMQRWREHLWRYKARNDKHHIFKHDNLVFEPILFANDRQYCEQIEHQLRPIPNIGWNIAPGGKDGYVIVGGKCNKERWLTIRQSKASDLWWRMEITQLKRFYRENKAKANAEHRRLNPPHTAIGKPYTNNKSGLKGVSWYPNYNKWLAQINTNNKRRFLGYFDCKYEAHQVYVQTKQQIKQEKIALNTAPTHT